MINEYAVFDIIHEHFRSIYAIVKEHKNYNIGSCIGVKSIYPINRPDITLIEEKAQNSAAPIKWYHVGKGIKSDFLGRLPYYLDDFLDGIRGPNTIQKTIATTLFLYFSVILPAVALGVLNSKNTHGKISVEQGMN